MSSTMPFAPGQTDSPSASPQAHFEHFPAKNALQSQTATPVAGWLALLMGIAIAIRLLVFFLGPAGQLGQAYQAQTERDLTLAKMLATQGQFSLVNQTPRITSTIATTAPDTLDISDTLDALSTQSAPLSHAHILRLPGYPALVAGILWLGLPLHIVLLLQCVCCALSVALIYGIAQRLFGSIHLALGTAVLFALHPASIAASNALASQCVLVTLLLAGIWLICCVSPHRLVALLLGGLSIGTATLFYALSPWLGPVLACWLFLRHRRLKVFVIAVLVAIVSLIPPGLWLLRNHHHNAGWHMSSGPAIYSVFYTASDAQTRQNGLIPTPQTRADEAPRLLEQIQTQHDPTRSATVYDTMNRLSRSTLLEHPSAYLLILKQRIVDALTHHDLATLYAQLGLTYHAINLIEHLTLSPTLMDSPDPAGAWGALLWTALNALLFTGALVGSILLLWRRQWSHALFLTGLWLYFTLFAHTTYPLENLPLPMTCMAMFLCCTLFAKAPQRPDKPSKTKKKRWRQRIAESFDKTPQVSEPPQLKSGRLI